MSPQFIEFLLLSGVAFFLISKLFSILGSTDSEDDDRRKNGSYFGEPTDLKNITPASPKKASETIEASHKVKLDEYVVKENIDQVINQYSNVKSKIPNFDIPDFVNKIKLVFEHLTNKNFNDNNEVIDKLIDKRFINNFNEIKEKYSKWRNTPKVKAHIKELYFFGNNVFVKVIFHSARPKIKEEWTFTRNTINSEDAWHLSNIEDLEETYN